jgi:uncharacterized protein (UPF0335 family)
MRLVCGEKKHPGGKLVRACIRLDEEKGTIHGVLLSGDFFADPEEEMEKLIERLETLETTPDKLIEHVKSAFQELKATVYGITVDDVVEALQRALAKTTREAS